MEKVILIAVLLASPCYAVENQAAFDAYRQRREARWANALVLRREMNAGKVYRYGPIYLNVRVSPRSMIEQGWVEQPPIAVSQRYFVPYVPLEGYYP